MTFYAHSSSAFPSPADAAQHWEVLFTPFGKNADQCQRRHCKKCELLDPRHGHLNKVAWWTAEFASRMFAPDSTDAKSAWDWGYLAGLWHDLGKFSEDFQRRLAGEKIQVEHAGAGAALAKELIPFGWETLAYVIAGHHCGLTNHNTKDVLTTLDVRISNATQTLGQCRELLESNKELKEILILEKAPEIPDWIRNTGKETNSRFTCFTRMIFSALVDADSIATESFCLNNKGNAKLRAMPLYDPIPVLSERLDRVIDDLTASASPSEVNRKRADIVKWCRKAAELKPGFFSLNVPTGGGKTLAGMNFGLRHAASYGLRRVIVAVPYTSIIEQNSDIYKKSLGSHNLVEHHSNLDDFDDKDESAEATLRRRLACENWDAPVIVTTNVQLFESLFTHKRRRARKLHHIAGSVIILDEAQCVPVGFMSLIVPMLRELTEHYGCTVVVCTATQPAWSQKRGKPDFGIPEAQLRPIIPPEEALPWAQSFDRVTVEWPATKEPVSNEELAHRLVEESCVMAIVHRKKDAQFLAQRLRELRPAERVFHLSTNMCPVHRRKVLEEIRMAIVEHRENGIPCLVVSTQLVEAGIDISLPVIYRAMAGLDSICQAAGRCNREGKMNEKGRVVVFYAETTPPDAYLKRCAEITAEMLDEHDGQLDIRDPAHFESFFRRLYHNQKTDRHNLQVEIDGVNFDTLGQKFRLTENDEQVPIVILYDAEARERLKTITAIASSDVGEEAAARVALRALQPYSVNVWPKGLGVLRNALVPLFPESPTLMLDLKLYPDCYDEVFGLNMDDEPTIPLEKFLCD